MRSGIVPFRNFLVLFVLLWEVQAELTRDMCETRDTESCDDALALFKLADKDQDGTISPAEWDDHKHNFAYYIPFSEIDTMKADGTATLHEVEHMFRDYSMAGPKVNAAGKDGWFKKVAAMSFCGGGHTSHLASWATTWTMKTRFGMTAEDFFKGKVISANSGGNWFITDMVYDADVKASFDEEVTSWHGFLKLWDQMIGRRYRAFTRSPDRDQKRCGWLTNMFVNTVEVLHNFCEVISQGLVLNWRKSFMATVNENYKKPLRDLDIDYWSITSFVPEVMISVERDETSNDPVRIHYYQVMEPTNEKGNTVEDGFTSVKAGKEFTTYLNFGKMTEGYEFTWNQVHTPEMDGKDKKFRRKEYGRRDSITNPKTSLVYPPSDFEFTSTEFKHGVAKSAGLSNPKNFGGPSSTFFGAVMSSSGLNANTALPSSFAAKVVDLLAWVGMDAPWVFNVEKDGKTRQMAFADGGSIDNTGLSASIYGLQKKFKDQGTIVLVLVGWTDLAALFKDNAGKEAGLFSGKSQGPKAIFEGRFDVEGARKFGMVQVLVLRNRVTIENEQFGIRKGSTYTIVAMVSRPKDFISNSNPVGGILPTIIGIDPYDVFQRYGRQVMVDLDKAAQYLDLLMEDLESEEVLNVGVDCAKGCHEEDLRDGSCHTDFCGTKGACCMDGIVSDYCNGEKGGVLKPSCVLQAETLPKDIPELAKPGKKCADEGYTCKCPGGYWRIGSVKKKTWSKWLKMKNPSVLCKPGSLKAWGILDPAWGSSKSCECKLSLDELSPAVSTFAMLFETVLRHGAAKDMLGTAADAFALIGLLSIIYFACMFYYARKDYTPVEDMEI